MNECVYGTVRVIVAKSDECGTVSDDWLHYVWVVTICVCFIRFVVKVTRFRFLDTQSCIGFLLISVCMRCEVRNI